MSERPHTPSPWWLASVAGGVLLLAMGLMLSCVSLSIHFDRGVTQGRIDWLLCFFFLALPTLLGGFLSLALAYRQRRQGQEAHLKAQVLALSREDGRVTAAELALRSHLSLAEAQNYLERLAARGICRMELTDEGVTCFVIEGRGPLPSEPTKKQSHE